MEHLALYSVASFTRWTSGGGSPSRMLSEMWTSTCGWAAIRLTTAGQGCWCRWSTTARHWGPVAWSDDRKKQCCLKTVTFHHSLSSQVEGWHSCRVMIFVRIQNTPNSWFVICAVHYHLCIANSFPDLDPGFITSCTLSLKKKINGASFLQWFQIVIEF